MVLRSGFHASWFLDDPVAHRITSLFTVPAVLAILARTPGIFDAELPATRSIIGVGPRCRRRLIRLYVECGILLHQA